MDSKYIWTILVVLGLVLATGEAVAQQPVLESPDQVGPYNVTSSVEMGVRGVKVEGDVDKYRSDLNYGPGFQFLDSSLLMEAAPGEGPSTSSSSALRLGQTRPATSASTPRSSTGTGSTRRSGG